MATETKTPMNEKKTAKKVETPASPQAKPASSALAQAAAPAAGGMLAVVLIRNRTIGVRHDTKRGLDRLRLFRRHICSVVPDNKTTRGLMFQVKDLTTFGPISAEMLKLLNEKRGSLKDREGKPLNVFRMHPPRGGWGHKGIKVSYQEGGCLGLRRKGMDDLLKKML